MLNKPNKPKKPKSTYYMTELKKNCYKTSGFRGFSLYYSDSSNPNDAYFSNLFREHFQQTV